MVLVGAFVLPPTVGSAPPSSQWPWEVGQEFRYVWVKGRQRVGETRWATGWVPNPGRPQEKLLEIQATRNYDHGGISQKAFGTTHLKADGTTLRFRERVSSTNANQGDKGARQEIRFENREQTAWTTYVHNGKEDRPIVRKHSFPQGTFLLGNQAVEHWVVLAAGLPREFETHTVVVYYPDQKRTFSVEFKKSKAQSTLKIAGRDVDATRYSFRSSDSSLKGELWIKEGRLQQLEFQAAGLKVILGKPILRKPKKASAK